MEEIKRPFKYNTSTYRGCIITHITVSNNNKVVLYSDDLLLGVFSVNDTTKDADSILVDLATDTYAILVR
jgi:hypothetical protein